MGEPEYLTPEQVAEKLQMNARVIRRMLTAGKLPGRRIGRLWRVSAVDLKTFMSNPEKNKLSKPGAK